MKVDDIIITEQLKTRPGGGKDCALIARTLLNIGASMNQPAPVLLRRFVEDALQLCHAGSAGVSLLDTDENQREIFRWAALAGAYQDFVGGSTPAHFSPCGACLERKSLQLYSRPARFFHYFRPVRPAIHEGLVVPVFHEDRALGTIWVAHHDPRARFSNEDAETLSSVAGFLGIVLGQAASAARHKALAACAPVGVFETDQEGRCSYLNDRLRAILPPEQKLLGQSWTVLLDQKDRRRASREWRRNLGEEAEYSREHETGSGGDGPSRWFHIRGAKLESNGTLLGYVGTVEEVTGRKKAEALLRASERLKDKILANSPDCIKLLDLSHRVIFINSRGRKILGATVASELMGSHWPSFWKGEEQAKVLRALAEAASCGRSSFQGRTRTPRGQLKDWWISITALPNTRHEVEGFLVTSRDITSEQRDREKLAAARRKLEEHAATLELEVSRRTSDLSRATELLRQLAGSLVQAQEEERKKLAHELHDQIGQQLTGLKLMLESAARNPKLAGAGWLAESNELLSELIGQVSAAALELRPVMIDRLGLASAVEWHLNRFASHSGLAVKLFGKLNERGFSPEGKLELYRIIQEALTNVARHAGATVVSVTFQQRAKTLAVVIQDNGRGFDPLRLQEFGSLGLVGMRERARRLGGELLVHSAPDSGTEIMVVINNPL